MKKLFRFLAILFVCDAIAALAIAGVSGNSFLQALVVVVIANMAMIAILVFGVITFMIWLRFTNERSLDQEEMRAFQNLRNK